MTKTTGRIIAGVITAVAVGLATTTMGGDTRAADAGASARVRMRDASGAVVGTVRFVGSGTGTAVRVNLQLDPASVAKDAFHGFHVHANNDPVNGDGCLANAAEDPSKWFASADGHLKIGTQSHGAHLGDLVSLYVTADGTVDALFTTSRFRPGDLVGRAVVVHAMPDNFANVPTGTASNQYTANHPDATTLTANTGNAGARIACGVVGR